MLPPRSASGTQKTSASNLGVSGKYEGVTAGANPSFNKTTQQQTEQGSTATLTTCNVAAYTFNLNSYASMDSSALDSAFYSDAVALINVGIGDWGAAQHCTGQGARSTLHRWRKVSAMNSGLGAAQSFAGRDSNRLLPARNASPAANHSCIIWDPLQ